MNRRAYTPYCLAVLSGALLPLAFAPYSIWPLAMVSPALLFWLWQKTANPKSACALGFSFGLGFFGTGVSWVFVSIHHYGNTSLPLAVLITTLFVMVLALFIAAQGYVSKRFFDPRLPSLQYLAFPGLWVGFEWLRSVVLSGFPWLYLGYAGLDTPLAGYGPLGSVYTISWIFALHSVALRILCSGSRQQKSAAACVIALLWIGGATLQAHPFVEALPKTYGVSLVQGNVEPFDKFTREDPIGSTEKIYGALTHTHWNDDLIIWPEGAIPLPLPYADAYVKHLDEQARQHNATFISGIQVIDAAGYDYNTLIALGLGQGLYHKVHLVPFGDFLPFDAWLRGLIGFFDLPMSSFKAGPKNQPLIYTPTLRLNPLICYEIAFPEQVRHTLRNADAIINVSEDGWFGRSLGPHQHLQIARMRALETGRTVLRATTSGLTAIIDPFGHIVAQAPPFKATVLSGTFHAMRGTTPWIRGGLWPLVLIVGLGLCLSYGQQRCLKHIL
ncbi:MAG: apolipoprotein N-acyltransferase [Gammaproteobacteria bacterium]|nr:apolipoprotein N-acyltransferase [Gammaproteobacteria bacterium]MBP9729468.1 apolipoprotein N-acyltransferase [Gammaproteobacteria bacterium]